MLIPVSIPITMLYRIQSIFIIGIVFGYYLKRVLSVFPPWKYITVCFNTKHTCTHVWIHAHICTHTLARARTHTYTHACTHTKLSLFMISNHITTYGKVTWSADRQNFHKCAEKYVTPGWLPAINHQMDVITTLNKHHRTYYIQRTLTCTNVL